MVCPNCGYSNQTNNRFCVRCGVDISAPSTPDTPSFDAAPPAGAPPGGAPAAPPPATAPPGAQAPAAPSPWGAPPPPTQWAAPSAAPPPPPYGQTPPYGAPDPAAPPNPFAPPAPYASPGSYAPPGAYGPYGQYPPPYPGSGYPPVSTNGLAITALVLGIVGWIPCGLGSVLAIIFGFVARGQIRSSQGRQGGDGLAQAGIILGFVGIVLVVGFWVLGALVGSSSSGT